ncbi:uncharacterized protein LOC142531678 isoform X1 [Primulina tabacum]|uniref:uncharacterized protein LOC142531678 isoform X1 n=1 Tax=Primulina tabacum TaxID=48773 RepID=UPI003F5AA6A8
MRSKKRTAGEAESSTAEAVEDPIAHIQSQLYVNHLYSLVLIHCGCGPLFVSVSLSLFLNLIVANVCSCSFFDGESLATLLKSFQREIESARALDAALPYKFWVKQQFSVGVNEVTRVLERMPPRRGMAGSSEESPSPNHDDSKAPRLYLQAIFLASDCNPRWLTKHLPALADSRNVPLVFMKDSKRGSLRLGELIKIKTTIAIGIKGRENSINQLIENILLGGKIDYIIEN